MPRGMVSRAWCTGPVAPCFGAGGAGCVRGHCARDASPAGQSVHRLLHVARTDGSAILQIGHILLTHSLGVGGPDLPTDRCSATCICPPNSGAPARAAGAKKRQVAATMSLVGNGMVC